MFAYYLRLAALALKRNRVLTLLMVTAIGIGIGASMTTLTVFYAMSGNPYAYKNDVLYVPQLDNWSPGEGWGLDGNPPNIMTYRDAMALYRAADPGADEKSGQARRVAVMMGGVFGVQPPDAKIPPFRSDARFTTSEFFAMFEPPFLYGGGWDRAQDDANARVVVLSLENNQKVFGGENSVGRTIRMDNDEFTVVGVLDEWHPQPRVYDVTDGAQELPEGLFVPIAYAFEHERHSTENNSCWKDPGAGYQAWLDSECVWLTVWVELAGRAARDGYKAFLDNYVMEQKKLGRFPRPLNNAVDSIPEWLDRQEVVRDDARIQMALAFSFLAVCLINTVGLLLAKFMGRAGEIGLRRALGASRRAIFAQFLSEAAIVGLCGGLVGLALTVGGLAGIRALDRTLAHVAQLDVLMVVTAIALSVLAALAAGLLPTWRACLIAPATQLKSQ
jgi:putative ABC transport system permease protein